MVIPLIFMCCARQTGETSKGHGASNPKEIGFQLYSSFKENNFSSLTYYTPDSQTITTYYEITTAQEVADTRRNIRHYAQHITEKLRLKFHEARKQADSLGMVWKLAVLDSVNVHQSENTSRFVRLYVDVNSSTHNGRILSKCVKINDMWFLSKDLQYRAINKSSDE